GKVHGSLARAGKVKSQTPKVEKQEKKKKKTGRAKKRILYNRRFVNVANIGKRRNFKKLKPMDPLARKAVNLNVLRRHDENIVEIIDSSSYVVVYKFDHEQSAWPAYGFIIMNRLGIDNFMAPLTDSMELEFKDEYIIYRTDDDNIHGIWVFETKDRERIRKQLWECRELSKIAGSSLQIEQPSEIPITQTTNSNSYGKPIDIVDLLKRAEIKQVNGITSPKRNVQSDIQSHKNVIGELFQNTNYAESLIHTSIPSATPATSNQSLDGKLLLDLLRQPANNSSTTGIASNQYISSTPLPQPMSLPGETASHDHYMRNSGPPFVKTGQSTSVPALLTNTLNHMPVTSTTSFGESNQGLQRTQVLDASIASLSEVLDRYDQRGNRSQKIMSKPEFTQRYLDLIQ
ncbi:14965_t:CDS:2, partial [Gigaspora margarita]